MSNGRKWRRGRVGAAAAAGLGMVVAPMALVGTASAAPSSISGTATNPVAVAAGTTSSSSPTFTVTIPTGSTFAAGDVIAIDVANQGATPLAAVSFSPPAGGVALTVSPTGAGSATSPGFSAALGHNAADPAADAAVTDEIDLLAAGSGTTTAPVTVTVTGELVTAGTQAATGTKTATVSYKSLGVAAVNGAIAGPFATVTPALVTAAAPAVLPVTPSAPAPVGLPNITVTEPSGGSLGTTSPVTVNVTLTNGTFASKPTVTSSNPAATVTQPTVFTPGSSTYTFTVLPTSATTGPNTLTISGITANEISSTPGNKIDATVSTGTTPSVTPAGQAIPGTEFGNTVLLGANTAANAPIAGPDVQTTAATNYQAAVANGASPAVMVLATDYTFPDALSGDYLAGKLGAGIALTDQNGLPPATASIISANKPSTIYVLGGPVAISPTVISQIQALYGSTSQPTIIRLGGADQFATNQLVINSQPAPFTTQSLSLPFGSPNYNDTSGSSSAPPVVPPTTTKTAIVASGTNYPDALAAGVLADKLNIPVILTTGDTLSSSAQSLLAPSSATNPGGLGVSQVLMVGGPAAISNTVFNQITSSGVPVFRVAGQDATDTAQLLAHFEIQYANFTPGSDAGTQTGSVPTYVARGDFGPQAMFDAAYGDALTAAPFLAQGANGHPILLTEDPNTVGQYLTSYLNGQGAGTNVKGTPVPGTFTLAPGASAPVHILQQFGGPVAITPTTSSAMLQAIANGTQP